MCFDLKAAPQVGPETDAQYVPPQKGPLAVLQQNPVDANSAALQNAAQEVAFYHAPDTDQAYRYMRLADALVEFLSALSRFAPPGPERSTAISRAREAKFWASAGIALEVK